MFHKKEEHGGYGENDGAKGGEEIENRIIKGLDVDDEHYAKRSSSGSSVSYRMNALFVEETRMHGE